MVTPTTVPTAQVTRLGDIATVRPGSTMNSINHYTIQRVIDVNANVEGRDLGSAAAEIKQAIAEVQKDLPSTSKIFLRGQNEVMETSFRLLGFGLILAVILVYAVLVVLFQSWVDPFIIMMAVPGALIGIIWTLALTGTTINVVSLMGAIMSIGIGVSNSILVVSFANDLRARDESLTPLQAVIDAGKTRLRPIMMTALAMIIGMMPMALGLGEGRRAERAARPRRHRRACGRDLRDAVPGSDLLHAAAAEAAGAAHARSTLCRRSRRRIDWRSRPWLVRKPRARPSSTCSGSRCSRSQAASVVYFHYVRNQDIAAVREARAAVADRGPRIEVVTTAAGPTERTIKLLGDVRSGATTTLYSKVAGYLKAMHVDKGDKVEAGQIIAEIESPELDQQYAGGGGRSRQQAAQSRSHPRTVREGQRNSGRHVSGGDRRDGGGEQRRRAGDQQILSDRARAVRRPRDRALCRSRRAHRQCADQLRQRACRC